MIVLEIVVLVLVGAIVTRFIRLSESAAPLRSAVIDRSDLLAKLLACPHCLSFWLALGGTGLLRWVKGVAPADSLLKMGTFVILGWRGSYYQSPDGAPGGAAASRCRFPPAPVQGLQPIPIATTSSTAMGWTSAPSPAGSTTSRNGLDHTRR